MNVNQALRTKKAAEHAHEMYVYTCVGVDLGDQVGELLDLDSLGSSR